jgi:hypothetical protein
MRIVPIAFAQWALTVGVYCLAAGREIQLFQSPFIAFLPTIIGLGLEYIVFFSSDLFLSQRASARIGISAICAAVTTAIMLWAALLVGANKWGV